MLIEKPACGDFLPILDGGFSLQYSPLLEYREGKGVILFCQMDVTGRTETDPAADRLARNLLQYAYWEPMTPAAGFCKVVYAGESAGKDPLAAAGFAAEVYGGGKLNPDDVLVIGPGNGAKNLVGMAPAVAEWLRKGGRLLLIGLDETEANAVLPFKVTMTKAEHIAAFFDPPDFPLAGVGPADVHNRDPRAINLVTGGAAAIGDGVLATAEFPHPPPVSTGPPSEHRIVFCQLAPWQFDPAKSHNVKQTYRRASFLVSRLLANMGAAGATPIIARFKNPVDPKKPEARWLAGLYLDQPEEWDDPYRFFRW